MFSLKMNHSINVALVKAAHSNALKMGTLSNLHVATRILTAYCKSADFIDDAHQLFDELAARADVICWNSVISGCVRVGRCQEAFQYFKRMMHSSPTATPDSFTLSSVLSSAYCLLRNASLGEQIHGYALKGGLTSSLSVQNALISLYAKWGRLSESKLVFDAMVEKNIVSWTALISGHAQQRGYEEESVRLFVIMMREGETKPNEFTFASVFSSCARLSSSQGMPFVATVLKLGFQCDINVQNSLVGFYAEYGWLEEAKTTFESITDPDLVSWNSLLKGYSQHGRAKEALQVFEEMQKSETPDSIAFLSTLSACRHAGMVKEGIELFKKMNIAYGIESQNEHISCVVDLLGRAGELRQVGDFIKGMQFEVGASVWRTVLGACRAHGESGILVELAGSKLLEMEPYDSETHSVLLHIYAQSGQWNKVSNLRRSFKEKGLGKEPGCSWIELGSRVHCFVSSDWAHPMVSDIRTALVHLTEHVKERIVRGIPITLETV